MKNGTFLLIPKKSIYLTFLWVSLVSQYKKIQSKDSLKLFVISVKHISTYLSLTKKNNLLKVMAPSSPFNAIPFGFSHTSPSISSNFQNLWNPFWRLPLAASLHSFWSCSQCVVSSFSTAIARSKSKPNFDYWHMSDKFSQKKCMRPC